MDWFRIQVGSRFFLHKWFNCFRLGSPVAKARKKKVKPRPNGANYNSFKYLLHDSEKQRLQNYNQMWKERHGVPACKDPRAIVHLGDNPLARPCWSINGHFPSLRRSMGLLWHCQSETIVCPKELLSLMGWPLSDELSDASGLAEPIEFPDLPRARKYAGNAIHVPTFGVLLLTCLACIQMDWFRPFKTANSKFRSTGSDKAHTEPQS